MVSTKILLKILVGILILMISFHSTADTRKQSEETIPFIIYKSELEPINSKPAFMKYQPNSMNTVTAQTVKELPLNEVVDSIHTIRKTICSSAGNADVKVWFSIDANGKILGIGMAAQSGLEVTFHCNK